MTGPESTVSLTVLANSPGWLSLLHPGEHARANAVTRQKISAFEFMKPSAENEIIPLLLHSASVERKDR
jgi:hypothetical protein